jgi:hypothetical protein
VLEDAFRQKAQGLVTNPPKPKVTSRDDAFIHAMPAYLGGSDRIGLKWVSGYEQNHAKGLPYIFGSVIMNDSETGRPIALLDGGWITEMRTPGVSGVTMRHVPGASRRLAIVGCGVQGRRHLEVALAEHPEIEEVVAYDYADEATQRLLDLAGDRQTRVAESPTVLWPGPTWSSRRSRFLIPSWIQHDEDALLLPVDYDDAMATSAFHDAVIYGRRPGADPVAGRVLLRLPEPTHLAAVVAGDAVPGVVGECPQHGLAMNDIALSSSSDRAERGVGTTVGPESRSFDDHSHRQYVAFVGACPTTGPYPAEHGHREISLSSSTVPIRRHWRSSAGPPNRRSSRVAWCSIGRTTVTPWTSKGRNFTRPQWPGQRRAAMHLDMRVDVSMPRMRCWR